MVRLLVAAAILWPVFLGSAVHARTQRSFPALAAAAYFSGSRVCHQQSARSFSSGGAQWPVCARCSGLYLGAPFGAMAAVLAFRRPTSRVRLLRWLGVAAVPTALAFGLEWFGAVHVSNLSRFLAAVPLGALVALVIVRTAGDRP
jgi:uncharacterized membrane protein